MTLVSAKYPDGRSGKWTVYTTFLMPKYYPRLRDVEVLACTTRGVPEKMTLRSVFMSDYLAPRTYGRLEEIEI